MGLQKDDTVGRKIELWALCWVLGVDRSSGRKVRRYRRVSGLSGDVGDGE